jgi:hypothetical protein
MDIFGAERLTDCRWLNLFQVTYGRGGERRAWQLASRQKSPRCMTGRFERPDAVLIAAVHETSRPHEPIEVLLTSPAETGRMCADPTLKFDAKAWLIMSRYAVTGRL